MNITDKSLKILTIKRNRDLCIIINRLKLPINIKYLLPELNIFIPMYDHRDGTLNFYVNNIIQQFVIKTLMGSRFLKYNKYIENSGIIIDAYAEHIYTLVKPTIDSTKELFIKSIIETILAKRYNEYIKASIHTIEINKHTLFSFNNLPFILNKNGFSTPIVHELKPLVGILFDQNIIINTTSLENKLPVYSKTTLISGEFKMYMLKTEFMNYWIRSDYLLELHVFKIEPNSNLETTNFYLLHIENENVLDKLVDIN